MNQKTLTIGHCKIAVKWSANTNVDGFICILDNRQTDAKTFYFCTIKNTWPQIPKMSDSNFQATVYAIDNELHTVVLSNVITIDQDSKPNMELLLNTHCESKSIVDTPYWIQDEASKAELLAVEVDQRVTEKQDGDHQLVSSVVFKCTDTRSSYPGRHYIQVLQSTSPAFREYITMPHQIPRNWGLRSKQEYAFQMFEVLKSSIHNRDQYQVIKDTSKQTFITHNTKQDMLEIFKLAESYRYKTVTGRRSSKTIPVTCLYRNKPSKHPTIISAMATGIMKKYLKDNNGNQASSINKQIKGLFFSASVNRRTKRPPEFSYFGDYRIQIPPEHILPGRNLYFADFYCHAPKRPHYITVVLTNPGSTEDEYCKNRLVQLDLYNNKFLYYDRSCRGFPYRSTRAMHVEVLCTEDVNLKELRTKPGFIEEKIRTVRGRGESWPNGIPKDTACEKCNIKTE